jgi:uncharacterized protein YcbK (DUF882 family)
MLISGIAVLSPKTAFSAVNPFASAERSLSLFNPHTKESFNGIYQRYGKYDAGALAKINDIMKDFRTGEVKQISTRLLDLLSTLAIKLESKAPFHVISGYRSPQTNALLRKSGKDAAKNSYHLKGQAADVRLPGCRISVLRRAAYEFKVGGVGYYPRSRFVHIDVGPIRYWKG